MYILLLMTVITSLTVIIAPRLTVRYALRYNYGGEDRLRHPASHFTCTAFFVKPRTSLALLTIFRVQRKSIFITSGVCPTFGNAPTWQQTTSTQRLAVYSAGPSLRIRRPQSTYFAVHSFALGCK